MSEVSGYLGKKGYTLYKSQFNAKQLDDIKNELTLKPVTPGQRYGQAVVDAFPVYRENANKIYVPRFYGEEHFGAPTKTETSPGENVQLEFAKQLRDYQEEIIKVYMDHVQTGSGGGILEVPCGKGKCLGKDTPIMMYDGSIKKVQEICVGDNIMGDDATPRKILSLARGREQMYKVASKKGDSYIVNESHILSLKHKDGGNILDICILDYLKLKNRDKYQGYRAQFATKNYDLTYDIHIDKINVDDYYGFEIDGNRRFCLGDFTVTHNTVMALKIICNIQKKTLILVHKEFLMNQWIERIEEFVPNARVGKIQAQICDIEDKDIVIGMIQTMYTKTYDQSVYDQFGLTVIDEVHRIGSEEFSKTLLKTITPYMLGISATVERKDKLTKLLYMFIGPKIYSEKREGEDQVTVRAIDYYGKDEEFNEVERDFRGQTKYSTMIRKLCEYGPRSDFIVRIIGDLIRENPDGQIMILAHNKSLLKYIYEKVTHMEIATAGYYIGGMKQKDLQATETKQIVIATYAMAAEALDIKTLSRLIMATPKSDITQSVGRILRMKHDNPIIVDICDEHSCFENQWYQRRRFYKKNQYKIIRTNSDEYNTDFDTWRVV